MKTALTIAGSDSSGGAGIQADIKTMCANHVFATSAITALTAQNTLGVTGIMEVTPEFLGEQLDAVFTDIYPDAVKIGMVSSSDLIRMIASKLQEYKAANIVVDPVMVATSGAKLISDDAIETLKKELLPLATVITPNIPEAEVLSGLKINHEKEMLEAVFSSRRRHTRYWRDWSSDVCSSDLLNGDPVLNPNSVRHIIWNFLLCFIFYNDINPGNSWIKITPAMENVLILAYSRLRLHALTFIIPQREPQAGSVFVYGWIHNLSPYFTMTLSHNLLCILKRNHRIIISSYVINR